MQMLPNYHVLTVKYRGATNSNSGAVLIRSDRFKQTKSLDYNYEFNTSLEIAQDYLLNNGFSLIGQAEGKDCYYIITTTFEPLIRAKNTA